MSKKANPALVGAFTFGAMGLVIAIILIFGSNRFMRKTQDCVLYFSGSVEGLDVGAPVTFRGVNIGAVKAIHLVYDAKSEEFRIPVFIELYKGAAQHLDGAEMWDAPQVETLVSQYGARAQLNASSLLTGKLNIALDFHPDTPVELVADHTGLPQIPTIQTPLEALSQKLAELPLEEIVKDLRSAMQGIVELVNSRETRTLMASVNDTLKSIEDLSRSIEAEFVPVARNMSAVADAAQTSMHTATVALARIQELMESNSPVHVELNRMMNAMEQAARNMALLSDAMERHPESIFKGRQQKERY